MRTSIVVAAAENGVIGKDGNLPWHLPDDFRFFKNLTKGHCVIMGRVTFESLPKPLRNRRNMVISRNPDLEIEGAEVFRSLEAALAATQGDACPEVYRQDEIFVIGGGGVYAEAFEKGLIDRVYLTEVHGEIEGDTHFQVPDRENWIEVFRERHEADERHAYAFTFLTLDRSDHLKQLPLEPDKNRNSARESGHP